MSQDFYRWSLTGVAITIAVLLSVAPSVGTQKRFESGNLKGFAISPLEQEIVELGEPFVVRTVEGVMLSGTTDKGQEFPPQFFVVFEIRGPDDRDKVLSVKPDKHGRFRIKGVPEGKYKFKATAEGWRSVIGTVIVSKKAERKSKIRVQLPIGV